jgi:hypothetical protein
MRSAGGAAEAGRSSQPPPACRVRCCCDASDPPCGATPRQHISARRGEVSPLMPGVRAERGLCLQQKGRHAASAPPTRARRRRPTSRRRRETGGVPGRCYAWRCTSHSLTAALHGSGGDSLSSLLKGGSGCQDGGAGCAQYSRGAASSL